MSTSEVEAGPFDLCLFRRHFIRTKKSAAPMTTNPATAPMTMPAIAPPLGWNEPDDEDDEDDSGGAEDEAEACADGTAGEGVAFSDQTRGLESAPLVMLKCPLCVEFP